MSNFDFLKGFNNELYEIGVKLEEDVINSPRAVTADATLFLETLVKDIYRLSKKKLEKNLISFYKKIDNLYRLGVISYIFKSKLQDAYNLRNKIHKNYQNISEEQILAFDIHQRLYYIAKKYFRDYCESQKHFSIPDYKKPEHKHVHFDNCIICGSENKNQLSNMCGRCNRKIENMNVLLGIKNSFNDSNFNKEDLINYGISESETISLLIDLAKDNVIYKKGQFYSINEDQFNRRLQEIEEYIEIGLLLTKFYTDEMSAKEIQATLQYWKGGINQKPYVEFYRLVNLKLEKGFEQNLCKLEDIKKSMKESSMDSLSVKDWFNRKKNDFIRGDLNEAFILFNELLIKKYFALKRKNIDETKIKYQLQISDELYNFWQNEFVGDEFIKRTTEIKKELILSEVKKNKSLKETLAYVGISQKEFERIYLLSKNDDDEFFRMFNKEYTRKRQKTFLRHLEHNGLNKAIRISKITRPEFDKWYFSGQCELSDFYIATTELLMEKYLSYRRKGYNKKEIINHMDLPKGIVQQWLDNHDLDICLKFRRENERITSNLVKRGKIINALKEDKSKTQAICSAGLTPREFTEIYTTSKREKSNFHKRFDEEYLANRKRLFPKLLKDNDFYNALHKCEITQIQFNRCYFKDQDMFIATGMASEFYIDTTKFLMDKYLKARAEGKNKPDSARAVGLSNAIVDKWIRHVEYDLFLSFKKKNDALEKDLIINGFKDLKSKEEISEIHDISLRTINEFIKLARRGFEEYMDVLEVYENMLIPHQIDIFIKSIVNKPLNKALKDSKITLDEIEYYYELGKLENGNFRKFYTDYLDLKIRLYADTILANKSSKIAYKNSNLTQDEFRENKDSIDDLILTGRFSIIEDELEKHNTSGSKLSKLVGISLDELYDWYFRGKDGEEKFEEFSLMFELGVILPRVLAVNHAKGLGVPKNKLHKKLKKDIGVDEYKIWQKTGIIDKRNLNFTVDARNIDEKRIANIVKNSDIFRLCDKQEEPEFFEFIKNAIIANSNSKKFSGYLSRNNVVTVEKHEITGK